MLKKYIQPFLKNNKCFIMAYDQGLGKPTNIFKHQSQNPLYIYNLAKSIKATGVVLNKGVAEIFFQNRWNKIPIIIKLDHKTSDNQTTIQTCSVEYAKALGAKAIGQTIYFGSSLEKEQIKEFAKNCEQAHKLKMGCILWAYSVEGDFTPCQNVEQIKNNIRICFELGADLIKLPKINDLNFLKQIKSMSPNLPIALRGGELLTKDEFTDYVTLGLQNDANGFIIGRNIWQQENAIEFGQKLHKLIFSK